MMPIFFHKSTIMLVDDDAMFTTALSTMFKHNFVTKIYNSPTQCLQEMQTYQPNSSQYQLLKADTMHDQYDNPGCMPVNFDIKNLSFMNSDTKRSQEISVMLVDFDMPDMNGIELCKQLANQPFKKILLTGSGNVREAIEALNKGYIDCYLAKGNETIVEDIEEYTALLATKYYADLTKPLLSHLEANAQLPQSDDYFKNYIKSYLKNHNIIEYSLIDKNGSIQFINEDMSSNYLIVHTDQSLDGFVELNDDVAEAHPYNEAIKLRSRIPFFGKGVECWQLPVSEWHTHFYEPIIIHGRQLYYTATLPNLT